MENRRELIRRLASELSRTPPAEPVSRMCSAVCQLLGVDGASVTLDSATGGRITLCATDLVSAALESAQEVLGEGPCIDAYLSGAPVMATLEEAEDLWPMFAEQTREHAAGRIYALPMHSGSAVLGVMSLYLHSASSDLDLASAAFLADALAVSVVGESERIGISETESWPDRRDVHLATGMVIAQLGVHEPDALAHPASARIRRGQRSGHDRPRSDRQGVGVHLGSEGSGAGPGTA